MNPTNKQCEVISSVSPHKLTEVKDKSETHILLIEDDMINQKATLMFLNDIGYHHVDTALNGTEALHLLSQNSYSLVLTDIELPDMDGFYISRIIRNNYFNAKVPIVAISALDDGQIKDKCERECINYLLNKPLILNDLKQIIKLFVGADLVM